MKHLLLLLSLLCLVQKVCTAQDMTGCIVDERQNALPFVNVVLLSAKDSSFVKGVVSDENGKFSISRDGKDEILKLSMVGYKTIFVSDLKADLGRINMPLDTKTLGEVLVKGNLQPYKLIPSGIRVMVNATPLKAMGTAEDVLCQMPGIKKKDHGIEVFGKGTPVVFLDGRQISDNAELSQLSSSQIKYVDVIRNPGTQYDASVKSVIRIVTVKNQDEGFGCDVKTAYFLSDYNWDGLGQFDWSYTHKKYRLYGSAYVLREKGHYPSVTDITVSTDDVLWHQKFWQEFNPQKWNIHSTWGMDWNISDTHELGFLYKGKFYPSFSSHASLTSEVSANDELYEQINSKLYNKISQKPTHQWDLFYNGKISQFDVRMDVRYLMSGNSEMADNQEESSEGDDRRVVTNSMMTNRLFASKAYADYKMDKGDVLVGIEYNHSQRNDDYECNQDYPATSYAKLVEQHVAPFLECSYAAGIGRFSLGVRYEKANFKYYENGKFVEAQSRSFSHVFPSLAYEKEVGEWQFSLAYAARTERPTYQQLSNNVRYANRFLLDSGNPYLKHEYLHNTSLSIGWRWLQLSLEYTDRRHAIMSWAETLEGDVPITKNTYINIPSLKNVMVSLGLSPKVGCWSPMLDVSFTKQWLTLRLQDAGISLNKPVVQIESKNLFAFRHGWTVFADFLFNSKGDVGNVENFRAEYGLNLGCTKSFWKDRASLQLKASDLLLTKYGEKQFAGNVINAQEYWLDSREVSLTFRLKLRKLNSKFKGIGAGEDEVGRL